ncbi:MAG: acyltransferase family protein [Alphaproteobacteria bacterium]
MQYRREIDGLRALAVLPVILFHAGFDSFGGGFVGVDIFFVISGYLITTIIVQEHERSGEFSIVGFYERRARRILPALFFVMACCLPAAYFLLVPEDLENFSTSLISTSTFWSNVFFWQNSGYFDTVNEMKPLLHTWSLAVEEQFYVLYPLLLMAVWRLSLSRWLMALLTLGLLASLALAEAGARLSPSTAFYLLPTRGWELLVGALAALYLQRRPLGAAQSPAQKMQREVISILGLAGICGSIIWLTPQAHVPGIVMLPATLGTAAIILYCTPQTLAGKLLGQRLVVGLGLLSYSAYLWHQPLFAFARQITVGHLDAALALGLAVAAIAMAYLSWRYVEKPFRDKNSVSRGQIFAFSAAGILLFCAIGAAGKATDGFTFRLSAAEQAVLKAADFDEDTEYLRGECLLMPEQPAGSFAEKCLADPAADNRVIVWGDSHAAALTTGLRHIFPNLAQLTTAVCPPLLKGLYYNYQNCIPNNKFVLAHIADTKPQLLIMHAMWGTYHLDWLDYTLTQLKDASPQTRIVLIGAMPQWRPTLPTWMLREGHSLDVARRLPPTNREEMRRKDAEVSAMAAKHGHTYLSIDAQLCDAHACQATIDTPQGVDLLIWDHGHLTLSGARYLTNLLFPKSQP